jgi:UDP-3-O-[3-hydroxymyristoyl] glucosamine N-acyltransferase
MPLTIRAIAEALGAEALGAADLEIDAPSEPASAGPRDLALAMDPKFGADVARGRARAALLWPGADWQALGLEAAILMPRPRHVMAGVTRLFDRPPALAAGIHPTALIDPAARIADGCRIGAYVVVGAGAEIGGNAVILPHAVIGEDARIGADALLHARVSIGARVRIGARFIAQPGAVIGSDGFSFVTPEPGAVEEARATGAVTDASRTAGFLRINSLGSVVIGDDVEVGANACIDRGTIADTVIGDGTKIDNMVQVGHNVRVGRHCLLCGQAGIAGSSVIGDRVVLGGQVGVADHVTIGSDVVVAGKSAVSSHVPPRSVMMGNPAMPMARNVDSYKALRRLPRLFARVLALENRVSKTNLSD